MYTYDRSKITIIVPAKNEGAGLHKIIKSVKPYGRDVIVVDGHSCDNTKKIVEKEKVRYILDNGLGRGDGLRMGIAAAHNEVLVFFDADGSHNERDIPILLKAIFTNKADLVISSRKTGGSFDLESSLSAIIRSTGSDLLTYLINKKFAAHLSDILFSFRAIKKSVAQEISLQSNGFAIEQEMVVSCLKHGYTIQEIPIREKKRAWGDSKLKTRTGIVLAIDLIKQLYF